MKRDEIVRHMSNLPSFLEKGKATPDRALSFGVMDWGRLESWQYQRLRQGLVTSNKCSPSSSMSSPLFSTDGSSLQLSRDQIWSPAHQERYRVTLRSHFNISANETVPQYGKMCLGNADKFQDFKDVLTNRCTEKKIVRRSETEATDCKMNDSYPDNLFPEFEAFIDTDTGNHQTNSSSLKGKMKIQDEEATEPCNFHHPSYGTCDGDHLERHKNVASLPTNFLENVETNARTSLKAEHWISGKSGSFESFLNKNTPIKNPLQSEIGSKNIGMQHNSARNSSYTSRSQTLEAKKSFTSSNNSDLKTATDAPRKQRSMSPIRRFSFSMSLKSPASTSTTKRAKSPISQNSMMDNSSISNRSPSSPLRRLLEPLFSSKATNSHQYTASSLENSKAKAKAVLGSRNGQEVVTNDVSRRIGMARSTTSTTTQAVFQTAVRNGRPMFTFVVENDSNVLAATVRNLSSSGKDKSSSWIYTFFTVEEVKNKNCGWLSKSRKDKGPSFVPNVTAQMKVSSPAISDSNTREFVLFHVDQSRFDSLVPKIQPHDELAAIVVKFSRNVDDVEGDEDSFTTTVVLPGGNHGVSSHGKPSPLIERWVSSGVCDCGGWDLGCRLRTLTNYVQSSRRSKSTTGHFELFVKGDVVNKTRFFNLCPLKEGIYSVEYNSSISTLQAFSICISVVDCRKSSQHTESNRFVSKHIKDGLNAASFASFPPLSPVGRV